MGKNGLLIFERDKGWADKYCPYKIIVNKQNMGSLKEGEVLEIPITPGKYQIFLSPPWSWHRSSKVNISIKEDENIYFLCKSSLRGWKIILALFYVLFLPHKYLTLETIKK